MLDKGETLKTTDTATLNAINDRVTSCKALKQVPIALSGRVPVKVDTTLGEIKAGDLLAPSSTLLGKAQKATSAGWVIGRALESSSSEKDTVMTLVLMSWWPGSSDLASKNIVGDVKGDMVLTSEIAEVKITKSLMSLGKTQLADTTIAGDLTINGDIANVFGELTFQGKKIAMTTDGSIKVASRVEAKTVVAQEFTVKSTDNGKTLGTNATVGMGIIKVGQNKLIIENTKVTTNAKVFITPRTVTNQTIAVTDIVNNTSFTVELNSIADKDITFDYWIILTE